MPNEFFYITGAIGSGKTTRVVEWCKDNNNAAGIAEPIINGRRNIVKLSSGVTKLLEVQDDSKYKDIIKIGNYCFDKKIFYWAQRELENELLLSPEYLFIDEFGKLELLNSGLQPAILNVLKMSKQIESTKIVIVVRDSLLQPMIDYFGDYHFLFKQFELF